MMIKDGFKPVSPVKSVSPIKSTKNEDSFSQEKISLFCPYCGKTLKVKPNELKYGLKIFCYACNNNFYY